MIHCSSKFYRDSYHAIKDYIRHYTNISSNIHLFPKKREEEGLSINPMNIIKQSSNKKKMNAIFKKLKIPHPETFNRIHLFKKKQKYIIKPIYGYGGKGKKVVEKFPIRLKRKKYFVQTYYPHKHHFRIYWLDGSFYWCIFRGGSGLIKNKRSGWKYFTTRPIKYLFYRHILDIEDCCKAYQKHTGIIFFAADIVVNEFEEWKFLEVNAMPQIAGNSKRVKAFVKKLKKLL